MEAPDSTGERIAGAALELFLAQGIRKTALEEVAEHAGVSRMTIYRYFPDRPALVREAFLRMAGLFARAHQEIRDDEGGDIDAALDRVFAYFGAMPKGPVLARLEELRRVYPAISEEYRRVRGAALNGIFECLRDRVLAQGLLRPGLNEAVVRVVFLEALVNIVDNPTLRELAIPSADVYSTLRTVLLHGVLTEKKPDAG